MELKYIKNQKDIVPTLYLYEDIGEIVGSRVVQEIKFLESIGNKEIHVRINSSGGSIIDGYSIIGALKNSSMTVTTFNDFMAASMAGLIFLSGDKKMMASHGLLMIHNPQMSGKPNKKQKDIMDKFRDSLLITLNESTNLPIDQLSTIMNKETWLNADESIELFGDIIEIYKNENELELNQLQMIHNSIKNFKNINNIMEKEIKDEVVKETKVESTIENNDDQIKDLNDQIQKLTSELNKFKEKEVENMENKIHTVLEPIKDTISKDDYNTFFEMGKTNIEFVENSVKNISRETVIETKDVSKGIVKEDLVEELINIPEMSRENPSKLKEIYDTNFDLYKRSHEKTSGRDYVE